MEKLRLNFYDIKRCGYYKRGGSESEFGNIQSMFGEIIDWGFDGEKSLVETCTYQNDGEENALRTFCFDNAVIPPFSTASRSRG